MRRLLPLLLAGALAGLTTLPTSAQNLCSPSTATTSRAQSYPGSTPYSNSGTIITSNCTGPVIDPGVSPDPYAGVALPVPGYSYGAPTSLLPSGLDAPMGGAGGYAGAVAPPSMGGPPGMAPSMGGPPGMAPSMSGYPAPAPSMSGYPGMAPTMGGYPTPAPSMGGPPGMSGYPAPAPSMSGYAAGPAPSMGGYGGPAPAASPGGYGTPPPGYGSVAGNTSDGGSDSTVAPGYSAAPSGAPSAYGYPAAAPSGYPSNYGAASYGGPSAFGYPPAAPYGMGYGPMPAGYPPYPMR